MATYNGKKKDTRFNSETSFNSAGDSFGFNMDTGVNPFKDLGNAVSDTGLAVVNSGKQLWNNTADIIDSFSKAPTNEQFQAIGTAMADATKEYWEKKKEEFKLAWNTKETVTVGSLVGRVADLAYSEDRILDDIGDRLAKMVGAITGTTVNNSDEENAWLNLAENMADDFLTYVTSDTEVGESIAEIDAIKGLVKVVKTAKQTKDNITRVLEIIEPLIPYAELVWEFASAYMSGGTSLIKATSDLDKQAQQALHKLIVLALTDAKKMVFSWEIEVPSLLLGSLDALTNVEKVTKYSTGQKWLDELLNEDYYKQIKEQSKWDKTLKETIDNIRDFNLSDHVDIEWKNQTVKNILTHSLVKNSLKNLLATAYANTGIDESEYKSWGEVREDIESWIMNTVLPWAIDFYIDRQPDGTYIDLTASKGDDFRMTEMDEVQLMVNSRYLLEGLV